jgi:hypothetical protein
MKLKHSFEMLPQTLILDGFIKAAALERERIVDRERERGDATFDSTL